ncbi:MAG: metallophosphoesterase [Candidatus Competibacteraceae bacterium]|nr:metallophosphoesterase [Candidatus Competibacteraceae bacterium]
MSNCATRRMLKQPVPGKSEVVALSPGNGQEADLPAGLAYLEARLGRVHLRQRLGIEADHSADAFGHGRTFFHVENWTLMHRLLRALLKGLGLYQRGLRNAQNIQIRHHRVALAHLPPAFENFTLLHLSDLHLDMHDSFPEALVERLRRVDYDICVLTGDFRARTFGDFAGAVAAFEWVRPHLRGPVYGILGNHDTIHLVPALERMGVRMLLNEAIAISREGTEIWLAGIDDPHYFRTENFDRAVQEVPAEAVTILLSHSPEPYRRAVYAGIDLMLSGHTHGGQICLPGGVALMTNADAPRAFCAGPWRYNGMQGYTSVGSGSSIVDVRFNCPPEITLHTLCRAEGHG